jgi:hypothetical protein
MVHEVLGSQEPRKAKSIARVIVERRVIRHGAGDRRAEILRDGPGAATLMSLLARHASHEVGWRRSESAAALAIIDPSIQHFQSALPPGIECCARVASAEEVVDGEHMSSPSDS